ETCAKLAGDFGGFVGRQATDAPQQRGQVFAIHIFHGEEWRAIGFADIKGPADVGVGDLASDANFSVQARQGRVVVGNRFRQKFQRYRLAQFEVFSSIHFSHAAASSHGYDAVAVFEHGARNESRATERA